MSTATPVKATVAADTCLMLLPPTQPGQGCLHPAHIGTSHRGCGVQLADERSSQEGDPAVRSLDSQGCRTRKFWWSRGTATSLQGVHPSQACGEPGLLQSSHSWRLERREGMRLRYSGEVACSASQALKGQEDNRAVFIRKLLFFFPF